MLTWPRANSFSMIKTTTLALTLILVFSAKGQGFQQIDDFKELIDTSHTFVTITYNSTGFVMQHADNSLTLVELKRGKIIAEQTPNPQFEEGIYRPEGMPISYYFKYQNIRESALFDTVNKSYVGYTYRNLTYNRSLDRVQYQYGPSGIRYITDSEPFRQREMEQTRSWLDHDSPNPVGPTREKYVFAHYENFICFDEAYGKVVILSGSGEVIASSNVQVTEPKIYSRKGQSIYYDEVQKEFFLVYKTNYGFNWYSLLPETGEAELVLQINQIWPNPNWKVENGFLSFEKEVLGEQLFFEEEFAL